jgi:hypothetical protein
MTNRDDFLGDKSEEHGQMTNHNLAMAWLAAVCAAAVLLWITGGWFHLELLPVSEHVRDRGLLTVFDWSVFDVNPARLRPLSDLIEVVDALMRPRTVRLFGHHASLSLSAVAIAIACPVLFHGALRAMGLSRSEALIFTACFVATIGFLSCFIPYIRPAKRLALLGLCALLYLVFRQIKTPSDRNLAWLCGILFLTLFADEAGFVYWPIMLLLLGARLRGRWLAAYCAIPVVYLLTAKVLLPPVYNLLGNSGARDGVIAESVVSKLLGSFLSLDFWVLAFEDFARAVAASFGTLSVPVLLPIAVVAAVGVYALARRAWLVFATSLSLFGASFFLSMLDMVNTSRNYMGEWTYYYHSPLAVLTLLWIAAAYHWLRPDSKKLQLAAACGVAVISMLNLANFHRVNELIRIMHLYPLAQITPRVYDHENLARRFESLLSAGALPEAAGLRRQFSYYREHPMGTDDYADRLERTFRKTRR